MDAAHPFQQEAEQAGPCYLLWGQVKGVGNRAVPACTHGLVGSLEAEKGER